MRLSDSFLTDQRILNRFLRSFRVHAIRHLVPRLLLKDLLLQVTVRNYFEARFH